MQLVDLSSNPRIPVLIEMVDSLSRITDPNEVLEKFIGGLRRAYGSRCFLEISTRGLTHSHYRISRVLTPEGLELTKVGSPWSSHDLPVRSGGFIGELIKTPIPKMSHNANLANDSVLGDAVAAYHSLMAAPIFQGGAPNDWVILLDTGENAFQMSEMEDLILRANLVAAATNNLVVAQQLFLANMRIQKEVEHIATIQRALLPSAMPNVPGLRIAASYETFGQAGGDMYDFVPLGTRPEIIHTLDDDRWAILIGDVSGHGPSAAVVMAMFHSILHAYPRKPHGPAELLVHVNRHLCAKPIGDCFVTAFLAFFDPATRSLSYARAGHNPPLLTLPSAASPISLDSIGDLPLGVMDDTQYHEASLTLTSGQNLLLYTDGITEARNPAGDFFGPEGLARTLVQSNGDPLTIIRDINNALLHHQSGGRPSDDQTVIAIEVE